MARPPDAHIRDLASRNGTYINDKLIGKRAAGEDQDGAPFSEVSLADGESMEETAKACVMDVSVVEAYEATLYDVKTHLHTSDYVALRCLPRHGCMGVDPGGIPGLLNLVAYHGGPLALETAMRVLLPSEQPAAPQVSWAAGFGCSAGRFVCPRMSG
jgi:hypothetical protein